MCGRVRHGGRGETTRFGVRGNRVGAGEDLQKVSLGRVRTEGIAEIGKSGRTVEDTTSTPVCSLVTHWF